MAMNRYIILAAMILLSGCSTIRGGGSAPRMNLSSDLDKAAMYGYYNEASRLLGMKGPDTISVRTIEGTVRSNDPRWFGKRIRDRGVALGHVSGNQVTLYTTHGRYHPRVPLWEMGRVILWANGMKDNDEGRRILIEAGFPRP